MAKSKNQEKAAALELLKSGEKPAHVAYALDVSDGCIHVWRREFIEAGLLSDTRSRANLEATQRRDLSANFILELTCDDELVRRRLSPAERKWLDEEWGALWDEEYDRRLEGVDVWSKKRSA